MTLVYVLLGREPGVVEQIAIEAGGAAVFARYGREAEREADQRAIQTLPAAGYDPEGVATFFEDLLEQQARQPTCSTAGSPAIPPARSACRTPAPSSARCRWTARA